MSFCLMNDSDSPSLIRRNCCFNSQYKARSPIDNSGETNVNQSFKKVLLMNHTSDKSNSEDLEEGKLYVVKDGVLTLIQTDPDDTMKKVRIMDEGVRCATAVQKRMRAKLGGYKPDLSLVCSALIIAKANEQDADECVANLFAEMTRKMTETAMP